jgi:hypothetical protein
MTPAYWLVCAVAFALLLFVAYAGTRCFLADDSCMWEDQ